VYYKSLWKGEGTPYTTEHDNQRVQLDKSRAKASSSAILIFRSCFCVAVVEVTVEK